ncbi:MAG: hypothetical protein RLY17_943 [Pseudomonadota bacterium]|jgi:phage protein U
MLVGCFGNIPFLSSSFVVHTFNDFKRTSTVRLAQHDVIGLKPQLELIGPALDKVDFMLRLDTSLGVRPLLSLNALRLLKNTAESNPLLVSTQYVGNFILTNISENWRYFGPHGAPRVIIVSVSLLESGSEWLNDTVVSINEGFKSGFK